MTRFKLWEQNHRYHTNWLGSKYKYAMRTFYVWYISCRSKNCSFCSIHVTRSLPSNFIILIFGMLFIFKPKLESLQSQLIFLFSSSWVSWDTFSPLGILSSSNLPKLCFNSPMSPFKPFNYSMYHFKPFNYSMYPFIFSFKPFILVSIIASIPHCKIAMSSSWLFNFELSYCLSSSSCIVV